MNPAPCFEAVTIPDITPITDDIVFDEKDASILGFAIKWRWPLTLFSTALGRSGNRGRSLTL